MNAPFVRRYLRLAALVSLVFGAACQSTPPPGPASSQGFTAFPAVVDEFLDQFAKHHPSIAAGNGLHQADDRLEDFSAAAIASEIEMWRGLKARLAGIATDGLTPDERVDHRIVSGLLDAWLLELETNRNWQRNLMLYASAISDGVHNLMTMESASAETRAGRIIAKVKGVPALLAAAGANLTNPPRVMAERGVRMLTGAAAMLSDDLGVAFADLKDEKLKAELTTAGAAAAREIARFVTWFEKERLPRADGPFMVGTANLEARYRAEELIDLPVAALLAIGERELAAKEAAFTAAAARVDKTRPALAVWADVLKDHPARGEVVGAAQHAVEELQAFVVSRQLVNLPAAEQVHVAAARPFDLGLASMHASPPLEAAPVTSYYYITDAQASWPAAQQDAWLQKFNRSTLAVITSHEVMPGHYVHSVFMRRTPGKIRRIWIGLNPFPQPSSGQDGWAHYAEQMMVDEGFRSGDPRYEMAQISESLTRICRLISGIRLHTGEWTVDQSATFFEEKAHLPAPAARQEAERGTYDPTYGGYFLGKVAAFKLRVDYLKAKGTAFSLREFNERVMSNGIAPWWAHRQLMLPGDAGSVLQ
ncbi:MAG TPA: DUF885 domain-containing protein [Vicinamibacterales bacterium]|nr:DUF885 domain-containing protein [Vicinamibacterales bacterium]